MSIRITVKQSSKCKKCNGIGYYSLEGMEYVCNNCEGYGKIWKDRDMPLSSLKKLLK